MGRYYSVSDLEDIFQWSYVLKKDEETNGLFIVSGSNGIPMSYKEHIKVRDMLNNFIDGYGKNLKQDLDNIRNSSYQKIIDEEFSVIKEKDEQRSHRITQGYVYIVKMGEYYKVGKTLDMTCRMGEYTLLPIEPEIVFCKKVGDYTQGERTLHEQYADKRVRGEWFKLTDEDIKKAKQLV